MRLQGRVTVARNDTRAEQLAPFAKGGLDGLLWVFDQDDRSQHWSDFLVKARELGAEPRITPIFSRAEIANAAWCHWLAEWHHGYPQPERGFAYRESTYDLSAACSVCDVGCRQDEPFRMRSEPRWGRRSVLQMFWVYDAWFVTPDAYYTVFQPFGIASREVLRKSGRPLDTVVQLVVDEVVPLAEHRTEGELCPACGVFKLHAALTDYAPQPKIAPPAPDGAQRGLVRLRGKRIPRNADASRLGRSNPRGWPAWRRFPPLSYLTAHQREAFSVKGLGGCPCSVVVPA